MANCFERFCHFVRSHHHHHHHQSSTRQHKRILTISGVNHQRKSITFIEMKQLTNNNNNFHNFHLMKCDFKILLIGSKGSGKTSLVSRFLGHPFDPRRPIKPTVGFNLINLDLNYDNDHLINVEIWDTAGGNGNHNGSSSSSLNGHFYYRNVNLIIVVFDLSQHNSLEECLNGLKDFYEHQQQQQQCSKRKKKNKRNRIQYECPIRVMIVGNKMDKNYNQHQWSSLIESNIIDYIDHYGMKFKDIFLYKTSSLTMEGLERLFDDITKLILETYHYHLQKELLIKKQEQDEDDANNNQPRNGNNSILEESIQSWMYLSIDLNKALMDTKQMRANLYEHKNNDDDQFNGIDYHLIIKPNNDDKIVTRIVQKHNNSQYQRQHNRHHKSHQLTIFLKKLFCLI